VVETWAPRAPSHRRACWGRFAWEKQRRGPTYALEAYCPNAGNALRLFPDLGFPPVDTLEALDWSRPHPVVVLAPAGLGTPLWHGSDRITVLGATSKTTAAGLAAAALAGVAHQIADALEALDHDHSADILRVGGGLSANGALLQAVADLSGRALEVAADPESTARGVATLAAEAVGLLDGDAGTPGIARRVDPTSGSRRTRAGAIALARSARGPRQDRHVSEGALSPAARADAVARLEREEVDVLVVGGGITGVGIALDAASRGLSVGLIEADDLAAGTSSRSSKLIHGGLRYLEMLEFRLVREALRERRLLLTRLAPHLVRPVEFLFP
jgi:hypothetical protein